MGMIAQEEAPTIWYLSRIKAAKKVQRYRDRIRAAEDIGICEKTLYEIEKGKRTPLPEEVWAMSEIYGAPELKCMFCHDYCRLGSDIPKVQSISLDRISIKAYNTLKQTASIKDSLLDIVADGKITEDEKPEMNHILEVLDEIVQIAQDLRICVLKGNEEGE